MSILRFIVRLAKSVLYASVINAACFTLLLILVQPAAFKQNPTVLFYAVAAGSVIYLTAFGLVVAPLMRLLHSTRLSGPTLPVLLGFFGSSILLYLLVLSCPGVDKMPRHSLAPTYGMFWILLLVAVSGALGALKLYTLSPVAEVREDVTTTRS